MSDCLGWDVACPEAQQETIIAIRAKQILAERILDSAIVYWR
jgi:hypothetical protein